MRPNSIKIRKKELFSFIILFEREDAPQNQKIIIRNT
jgi:hypothetical protein